MDHPNSEAERKRGEEKQGVAHNVVKTIQERYQTVVFCFGLTKLLSPRFKKSQHRSTYERKRLWKERPDTHERQRAKHVGTSKGQEVGRMLGVEHGFSEVFVSAGCIPQEVCTPLHAVRGGVGGTCPPYGVRGGANPPRLGGPGASDPSAGGSTGQQSPGWGVQGPVIPWWGFWWQRPRS